ncbi:hypothetical protein FRC03_003419 [Tulasnella sp. 419]|nr:hypothetical protein FRC03_003419 [Tulasnella sp. 419]
MSEPPKYDTLSWDEKPVEDTGSSLKITRVRTTRKFTGKLAGTGVAEYLMVYHPSDAKDVHAMTASYTGLMLFKGTFNGGEEGEAVFIVTTGKYEGAAVAEWIVDSKSTSGGLKGLKGRAGYNSKGMTGTEVWEELSI